MREFTLEQLEDWGVEFDNLHQEEIDTARWYRYDEIVFQAPDDKKFYKTSIRIGLTENQEVNGEFVFPDMETGILSAPEVEKKTKTVQVTVWDEV